MKKRKMVTLRFTSLILATLYVFQSLRISSLAHAHHARGEIDSSGTRLMVERHYIAPQKEQIRGAVTNRKGFGGRKLVKDAGNDHEYAQMSTFRKAKDSAKKEPRTKTLNVSGNDHESQSAIDAEIETFMYRDYHGMRRPRRRPPVNNGMPND